MRHTGGLLRREVSMGGSMVSKPRFLLADNTFTIVRSGTREEQRNPVSHV